MAVKLAGGRMAVEMTAGIADTTRTAVVKRPPRANFPPKFVDIDCSSSVKFSRREGWVEQRQPFNLSQASIPEAIITFEPLAIRHRVA